TIVRATAPGLPTGTELAPAVGEVAAGNDGAALAGLDYEALAAHPLARWAEDTFGIAVEEETGRLIHRRPTTVDSAAARLAEQTGVAVKDCGDAIRATLLAGSRVRHP